MLSENFKVSVVIPVYNAAAFIEKAIESALSQDETGEIVIVDDGSTDHSFSLCEQISKTHTNIHLLEHPDGKNRGIAATRNLGIKHCTCDFVAFLDADDYYLPGRFIFTKELFLTQPEIDGVYEAVGFKFDSEEGKIRWSEAGRDEQNLITIKCEVDSKELFKSIFNGKNGYFHFNGLTLKKIVFEKTGLENESIIYGEDTDYMFRLAASATLTSGKLDEAVAVRVVHDHNTISTPRSRAQIYDDRLKQRVETWRWLKYHGYQTESALMLGNVIMHGMRDRQSQGHAPAWLPWRIITIIRLVLLAGKYPDIASEKLFWRKLASIFKTEAN